MLQKIERIRHARKWLRRRKWLQNRIDAFFWWALHGYELPRNSRWSLFAELFWIECPVCMFYRGASFGFLLASLMFTVILMIIV